MIKPPQHFVNPTAKRVLEFNFHSDLDENGLLFYLGSAGKRQAYQNPHLIGQVQVFASSLGSGSIENFIGRSITNTRTANEPFSFFGIDLGEGRRFLPTLYTLRNRNSQTHVMMNWHLEGSNDKLKWTVLDRRTYFTGNPGQDQQYLEEQKLLRAKGGCSSWGVDQDLWNHIGRQGFRFFRII